MTILTETAIKKSKVIRVIYSTTAITETVQKSKAINVLDTITTTVAKTMSIDKYEGYHRHTTTTTVTKSSAYGKTSL